jgi:hypothetical protein
MEPILLLINMQAAIELVNAKADYHMFQYKAREDHLFAGRPIKTRKDAVSFKVSSTLFADQGAFLFGSQDELQKGMDLIFRTFRRLGSTCHVGRGNVLSAPKELV